MPEEGPPNVDSAAEVRRAVACGVIARVARCDTICRDHVAIELALPCTFPSTPGQFVQLLCREGDERDDAVHDWPSDGFPPIGDPEFHRAQPYLRRPFSIADQWSVADGGTRLRVISRTVGPGTQWLARLRAGDPLDLTGPLGRGFRIPPRGTSLVLVGGGVGIPPLLYLARRLHESEHRNVTLILGATTRALLPVALCAAPEADAVPCACVSLPANAPFGTIVATDDGTAGVRGLVTDALADWNRRTQAARGTTVFACGPERMLQAVAKLTRAAGFACQLCIERNMGCGVGTCLSCVVRVRAPRHADGWRWALACTEGPVFDRDELLDYAGSENG